MAVHFIAITGGSGAGKTWLAKNLKRRLGRRAGWLSLDDFYQDLGHLSLRQRARVNFDHPEAIDWALFQTSLEAIRAGGRARLPRYDFARHTRQSRPRWWQPRPVVILDGLWLLHRPALRALYAHMIFVDCPEEIRLARRIARDAAERGRSRSSVLRQWRRHVQPMYEAHVAPQLPLAKLVVTPATAAEALPRLVAWAANLALDFPCINR
jgi:uridine kinase